MKGIILAAGQGTRLRPLTDDKPKCMVEFKGRPIVEYTLETFRLCDIRDICIVHGYMAEKINYPTVHYVHNSNFASSNMVTSLFCAEQELNDDVVVAYGDIIFNRSVLDSLIRSPAAIAVSVDMDWETLWSARMEDPLLDAETLKLDGNNNIIELGKKPKSKSEIQGQYMGLIKFTKEVLPRIRSFYYSLDRNALYDGRDFDNMFMTTFLQLIIDNVMPIAAVPVKGGWIEVDCSADLKLDYQWNSNSA